MAVSITVTPGGASDNCYVTLANATLRFTDTLREPQWDAWPDEDKNRALIQATRKIEKLGGALTNPDSPQRPLFDGAPLDTDQALHFPRSGGIDTDSDGNLHIPESLEDAVAEQAFWSLQRRDDGGPLVDRDELRDAGVKKWSSDGAGETYGGTEVPRGISPAAWDMMKPYMPGAGTVGTSRMTVG